METKPERRYLLLEDAPDAIAIERRDGEPPVLAGISPPWNSLSVDLGGFREQFSPTAFDGIVDRHPNDPRPKLDVPFLINHDQNLITGRTSNGRLTIQKEARGLGYRHTPIQTTAGRDLVLMVEDRTITGSSFAFTVADGGDSWTEDAAGAVVRTVHKVSGLFDISAVTSPAYPASSIAPRSLDAWKDARKFFRQDDHRLTISVDYDRTFSAAPGLWRSFIQDATARGHRIVCVSRREPTDANREELRAAFADLELAELVLCGANEQKRSAARTAGIEVDVWVDDYPEGIVETGPAQSVRLSTRAAARAAAAIAIARAKHGHAG